MKVRITDLLDQYEDSTVRLTPAEQTRASEALGKEIIALKEKKHRFGWREGLAALGGLAAVAALVLMVSGVIRFGSRGASVGSSPETAQPSETKELLAQSTEPDEVAPTETAEAPNSVTLSNDERAALNRFLTRFSEQGWTEYDAETADEYQLVSFAHLYCKINDRQAIAYKEGYETLTLEQVNDVLSEHLGKSVDPEEGTDYTAQRGENYAVHEQYHDGLFWFPAADGDMHTAFTVCEDDAVLLKNGDRKLEFRVYDVYDLDDEPQKPDYGYDYLSVKTAEELVWDGTLCLSMCGMAILRPAAGGWELVSYQASFVEPEHSDDWEEEWPDEYPVKSYKLKPAQGDSVFAQTGALNVYRYEQLPAAEDYAALLQGYLDELKQSSGGVYDCGTLVTDAETMHDGYANHFAQSETTAEQGASLSGSSVTGRFSFSLWPGQYAPQLRGRSVSDRAALEEAARSFVKRFEGITGLLVLQEIEDETLGYSIRPDGYNQYVEVSALTFRFTAAPETAARPMLEIQDGRPVPVTCGDSTLDDLGEHSFSVTVLPDGTVAFANNYVTRAEAVPDGTTRMIDESDMETLLSFMTSYAENDCAVFTSISADCCSVYFGSAEIEPTITVKYYYESAPDEPLSTEMVLPGLFD